MYMYMYVALIYLDFELKELSVHPTGHHPLPP